MSEQMSEQRSESVNPSVESLVIIKKTFKFFSNFWEWVRNDLKTFLGSVMPKQY